MKLQKYKSQLQIPKTIFFKFRPKIISKFNLFGLSLQAKDK